MWQIYADADLIYDGQYQDRMIVKGEFDLEVNHSGSFTFVMYPDHPLYNVLTELKSTVKAYRNNELMYRGRIIRRPDGFNLDRTFICEGELSFLVDGIVRPYSFSGTPEQLFTKLIEEYNTQVSEDRRFKVGLVTVTDPNNYISRANSNYPNTLDELMDKLVEPLGGYIVFTSDGSGDRVINWLQYYPSRPVQSIDFGENLLDYANVRSAEQIATALIPLGTKLPATDDIEPRLTIESVNDGKDYIYDEDAVRRYGWIYTTRVWDDVTLPENLLTKGRAALAELVMPTESIELSALDMSALNSDISAFRIGDIVPVQSDPHNLNSAYLLSKQTIDVLRPEANKITLGYSGQTLTSATLAAEKLGADIEVLMGYGDALQCLGAWYVQLLAESLGKRLDRNGNTAFYGRTPIVAVGTTDMHSMTQQHQDGKRNKVIQFLEIEKPAIPLVVDNPFPQEKAFGLYAGKEMDVLLKAALTANETALTEDGRLNARYVLPELAPRYIGQLLMFLMYSIAYEGELADVDAYDQPGVEAYKRIMKAELAKA